MNYFLILPEIILCSLAILTLIADLFLPKEKKSELVYLILPGLLLVLAATIGTFNIKETVLSGSFTIDPFSFFFKLLAIAIAFLVILSSMDYLKELSSNQGEFYALLLFSTLGIILVASSSDLIIIYLALEFTSITCYILAGMERASPKSSESAIKYFLLGAVCSAVMLYGMSLIYGLTGSTNIYEIAKSLTLYSFSPAPLLLLSTILILTGFGFKMALVPYHQWCPDTYEGAPTPVTAFLSVGPKAAGFAVLLRVFLVVFPFVDWQVILVIISVLSMTLGNLVAIVQKDIKRMLAYSSIAQAGYILIGLVSARPGNLGIQGVLVYLLVYIFMNLGAFTVVIIFSLQTKSDLIEDYAGLSQRAPFLALSLSLFLLSLAGIPPLAGFLGKFFVFAAAISADLLWLAIVGVINSVISVYYYCNVIRQMYLVPAKDGEAIYQPKALNLALAVNLLVTIFLVFVPFLFAQLTKLSTQILGA